MKTTLLRLFTSAALLALAVPARAQCNQVLTNLRSPMSSVLTNEGNLLVAEAGNPAPPLHSGRISIVEPNGTRRTLIDGLPSAPADVGDPSGPSGLAMRGRTLYVAIGVGDVAIRPPGPPPMPPRTALENPAGPSSLLFSSVLMIQFSAAVEKTTTGVTLTAADQQSLAAGQVISLGNGKGGGITVKMVANFLNFVPAPSPVVPLNIRASNPFGLIAEGDSLYVTDGSMNQVWRVDLNTGGIAVHATFPNIPNPFAGTPPPLGIYPDIEPVPAGIASDRSALLVSLFTGFPFAAGVSSIQEVDPVTGAATPLITGRKNAIAVLPVTRRGDTTYFVLQYASGLGPFFGTPGHILRFDDPSAAPTLIADCLATPTSMTWNEKTGTLYVTEFGQPNAMVPVPGRLVSIPFTR